MFGDGETSRQSKGEADLPTPSEVVEPVEIEDAQAYLATSKATELGDAMDAERVATS